MLLRASGFCLRRAFDIVLAVELRDFLHSLLLRQTSPQQSYESTEGTVVLMEHGAVTSQSWRLRIHVLRFSRGFTSPIVSMPATLF